ncbi:hypothetical protein COZ71_09085 [Candidatus Desantisbacteria bacterium CG_4_8_14_3_um_filter_40_12]|uniref:Ribosomal RNA small subunit methyltransferase E PUA-like domain-containing protein n=2 Tax=unclassified Candidatus Desantisiibacteriota TaxID=3106372 RepID=A0A2M7J955_9BACT|nr:MAG: hypothetical protein COX18_09725 [Candidatus Desantisbacteria bacterium CG23_combo_of_CG06-09_8_20_14_all_40_23]PIX15939.1 MAG: hypothetical protein COZ71_09085 [Candidatus Desantisbacteria bacterium CG_4_8_14_3_um_filter_40_12]
MEHNRFFIPRHSCEGRNPDGVKHLSSQITQNHITITDTDNLHHIKVIRLGINEKIVVLDGKGNEYHARISSISKEQITASIVDHLVYSSHTLQITIV